MNEPQQEKPDRAQLRAHRQIFWTAWQREQQGLPLEALQIRIVRVIRMHPEYHALFDDEERFLDRDVDTGAGNPYLHLSLHLAIEEQLVLRQPPTLADWIDVALTQKKMDRHDAIHVALDILGTIMDEARYHGNEPDSEAYYQRLQALVRT